MTGPAEPIPAASIAAAIGPLLAQASTPDICGDADAEEISATTAQSPSAKGKVCGHWLNAAGAPGRGRWCGRTTALSAAPPTSSCASARQTGAALVRRLVSLQPGRGTSVLHPSAAIRALFASGRRLCAGHARIVTNRRGAVVVAAGQVGCRDGHRALLPHLHDPRMCASSMPIAELPVAAVFPVPGADVAELASTWSCMPGARSSGDVMPGSAG